MYIKETSEIDEKRVLLWKSNIVRNDGERRQSPWRSTKNSETRLKNIKTGQAAVIWMKLSCSLQRSFLWTLTSQASGQNWALWFL